jgi:hypothetical protein
VSSLKSSILILEVLRQGSDEFYGVLYETTQGDHFIGLWRKLFEILFFIRFSITNKTIE